jgi:hypothetical protein
LLAAVVQILRISHHAWGDPVVRKVIRSEACISIRQPYDPISVVALPQFRLFLINPADISASA